ncbi:hypothetical protein PUN28_005589 [Cardiocondyla obscurior]|uniref:Uncharacterized protein n=1 Tax=Cardiocondyla obscurior TaxID=286306 RepID=A0AAW2GJH8_9HYME
MRLPIIFANIFLLSFLPTSRNQRSSFSFPLYIRILEMITHLLNLYSTLLSLRRKKKGEVFLGNSSS